MLLVKGAWPFHHWLFLYECFKHRHVEQCIMRTDGGKYVDIHM